MATKKTSTAEKTVKPAKAVKPSTALTVLPPLEGRLDQPTSYKIEELLNKADAVLEKSFKQRNPDIAFHMIGQAAGAQQASIAVTAVACYKMRKFWASYQMEGDWRDYAEQRVGKSFDVLRRYADVGEVVEEKAPKDLRTLLWMRPYRNLIAIAQFCKKHGDIAPEKWKDLAQCVNGAEVREKLDGVREVVEKKPTNRLTLYIDRDGVLYAKKQNKKEPIGALRVDQIENQIVAEAVQRIITSSGILEG